MGGFNHPFKRRELKVLRGTHGTEPMGLWGGQEGLEKHTKPKLKKQNTNFIGFLRPKFKPLHLSTSIK